MIPTRRIFVAIESGTFSPANFTLQDLSNALTALQGEFRNARRHIDKGVRNQKLAALSVSSNQILKGIAAKWAERGPRALSEKIRDLERKEADPERSLNPYDAIMLDFLRAEMVRFADEKTA
jgi:hypothetical protein